MVGALKRESARDRERVSACITPIHDIRDHVILARCESRDLVRGLILHGIHVTVIIAVHAKSGHAQRWDELGRIRQRPADGTRRRRRRKRDGRRARRRVQRGRRCENRLRGHGREGLLDDDVHIRRVGGGRIRTLRGGRDASGRQQNDQAKNHSSLQWFHLNSSCQ